VVTGQREAGAGPLHQRVRGDEVAVGQVDVGDPQETRKRIQPLDELIGVDPSVGAE
jgi:hypothetical protein